MDGEKKLYYQKRSGLYGTVERLKLWPSRSGMLHGVKSVSLTGEYILITTHCGESFRVRNSRNCRAARWLRNKWAFAPCPKCKVPEWKLEKYAKSFFVDGYGKVLKDR